MITTPRTRRVTVFELDDLRPRIRPDRPNVYVAATASRDHDAWARRIVAGVAGPEELRGHVRAHLRHLGGKYLPRPTKRGAGKLKRRIQDKLIRSSHRVQYRESHRLYVIELDPTMAASKVDKAWLYVGQTTKDPLDRLRDHRTNRDNLGARDTRGTVLGLRPDLVTRQHPLPSKQDAEQAEAALAHELLSQGFDVTTDQLHPRRLRTRRRAN